MTKHHPKATELSPSDVAFTINPQQPVLFHGRDMQAEVSITPHSHPRGQLLWAEKGVLRVTGAKAVWVVPCTHAMWIPGGVPHQVSSETNSNIRNIYIDPSYSVRQNDNNIVMVNISALMREIILRLSCEHSEMGEGTWKRLGLVAIDELEVLPVADINIHSGQDPRLQRVIRQIVQHPNQMASLADLSTLAGASIRTMERLFKNETGMTFRQWRSRFRLMNALIPITEGNSSTAVAYQLGYQSVSSFICAFKTQFGCTPQEYNKR